MFFVYFLRGILFYAPCIIGPVYYGVPFSIIIYTYLSLPIKKKIYKYSVNHLILDLQDQ